MQLATGAVASCSVSRFARLLATLTMAQIVFGHQTCPANGESPRELSLIVSLPYPNRQFQLFDPSWNEGDRVIPALYLARDQINARSDILPCHRLELVAVDSGCDISATTAVSTVVGLFDNTHTSKAIGMVGPGCSASSLHVANVLNRPEIDLVHVHGAGTPSLSNRTRYKNSMGILGSTRSFVDLSIALMKKNSWHNIAILFESGRVYYRTTKEEFVETLRNEEYAVNMRFVSPVYSTYYPLDGVRNSLSRIVFLFAALSHTYRILCLAYHEGMFYPAYQWVIISHRLDEFGNATTSENVTFMYDQRPYTCSLAALINTVLEGAFLINYQLQSSNLNNERPFLANTSFNEFLELYDERSNTVNVSATYWAYYLYDAIWAWAHVLDRMTINSSGIFDDFQYGKKTMTNIVLEHFYADDFVFEGMSGTISFNSSTGFYDRPFNLYQVSSGGEIHTAFSNGTDDIIYTDGVKPIVISDVVRADTSVRVELLGFFAAVYFLLLVVIVSLHVLTVKYKDSKSVKASSPKMSHFAFIGAYMLLIGLLLLSVSSVSEMSETASSVTCHLAWAWLIPVSITLFVGTVTLQTWRLYRIFNHYLDPGPFISNAALISILMVLLLVDIIIAVLWTAIDRRVLTSVHDTIRNGPATELVIINTCRSRYETVWSSILMIYKVGLSAVMVTLALLTHNIPNKTFATTSLRVFSYTHSAVFVIGLTLYYLFTFVSTVYRLNSNIRYTVLHTSMSVIIVFLVLFVFLPPLVPLLCGKTFAERNVFGCLRGSRKVSVERNDDRDDETRTRKTSSDKLLPQL